MRVTGSSRERKLIISHNAENQIRNRKGMHLSHFASAVPRNQNYQQKALEAENHLVGRMGKGRMTRESDTPPPANDSLRQAWRRRVTFTILLPVLLYHQIIMNIFFFHPRRFFSWVTFPPNLYSLLFSFPLCSKIFLISKIPLLAPSKLKADL